MASGGAALRAGGLTSMSYRFGTQSEQLVRNFTIWKLRRSDSIFTTRSGVRNTLGVMTGVVTLPCCATTVGIRTPLPGTFAAALTQQAASFP